MIAIRQLAANDDLADATALLQRFFIEEGFDTPPDVIVANTHRLAALDSCGLFLAESDGAAIGVATVSLEFGIEFGWSAEMGDLYVVHEWRGKGISRRLMDAIESFLRGRGAAGYQVTVTPFASEHHALEQFYGRLGFEGEGRRLLYKRLR